MPSQRTAVIAGATGLVGGHVVARLLARDWSDVTLLVRRDVPATDPRIRTRIVDFDRLDASSIPRADAVFCCLGTTIRTAGSQAAFRKVDFDTVVTVARAASQAGARQFLLVSSMGADPASRVFYSRVKGEAEKAVTAVPFEAVHIFRPSVLTGEREESRPGETIATSVLETLSFLLVGPARRFRPIAAADVAAAMVRVAEEGATGAHVYESDRIHELAGTP